MVFIRGPPRKADVSKETDYAILTRRALSSERARRQPDREGALLMRFFSNLCCNGREDDHVEWFVPNHTLGKRVADGMWMPRFRGLFVDLLALPRADCVGGHCACPRILRGRPRPEVEASRLYVVQRRPARISTQLSQLRGT